MKIIELDTYIDAPVERVFDLSRSVDAHLASADQTSERAIAGVTTGLLSCGDEVTWEGIHFGLRLRMTVQITALERPHLLIDEMVKGPFKSMRHVHRFQPHQGGTQMHDQFAFEAPLGVLGRMVEALVLEGHMRRFLEHRNQVLKALAESDQWRALLAQDPESI